MKRKLKHDALKIDSVLVPLDFSRPSFKALEYAAPLAERLGAELHLVHAFDYDYPMSTFSAMPLAIPEADSPAAAGDIFKMLRRNTRLLRRLQAARRKLLEPKSLDLTTG